MRRLMLFIVTVLFIGGNCFAQNENKFKSIRNKLEKNEVKTGHPKKGIDPKTWMERGKLYQDAYEANLGFFRDEATVAMNLSPTAISLYFRSEKEPKISPSYEENGVQKQTIEYSQIKLNFANGRVYTWIETEKVVDNALIESINAYKKAQDLDTKRKNEKKILDAFNYINADLDNKFTNEYNLELYIDAYNTALKRIELNKHLNEIDTEYYFFAGYVAKLQSEKDSSMWKQSIEMFEKALSFGFYGEKGKDGQIYNILYETLIKSGDTIKAVQYLKEGIEKFPSYDQLFFTMTQHYININENDMALEFLNKLIEKDSTNANLINHKGRQLYMLERYEEALKSLDASIALDSNFYEPYFHKSNVYIKLSEKSLDLAYKPKITYAESDKYIEQSDEYIYKAIKPLEKAHELIPEEISIMENLKILYFRLRVKYPEMERKHLEISHKLSPDDISIMESLKTLYLKLSVDNPEFEQKHLDMEKKIKKLQP